MGRSRGHNGSNQRQSGRCRYTNPSYGDTTGRTLNGHYGFHKQMRIRQLVQGQHGFVH
ncbi:MAG TPA: hypothetical protein VJP02_09895 [Candidatus Sulfotelmatobacter sp.]|nr:hypothetical protein [Candidatus Sulfotelmatobacter sp.]